MLRSIGLFIALIFISGCETDQNSSGFSDKDLEDLKSFEGVKPGEVSLSQCNSSICGEVRETESASFMLACMDDTPMAYREDQRKYCECARDDLFEHNSLQTLMTAYESREFRIAMPNIEQCAAEAFFQ